MNKEERLKLYNKIAEEIKEEKGKEVSISEIHSIVESQFKIMAYGFSKGVGSHITYIGKFLPFDMDYYAEKIIIPNKQLQAKLKEEGKGDEARAVYVDSYKRYKKLLSEKNNEATITAEELINIPYLDESTDNLDVFKNLR